MPLLDERGRLFGRFNLIDASLAFFVALLVVLAYVSWLLFRTPKPEMKEVTPVTLKSGVAEQYIQIKGQNLTPFLHIIVTEPSNQVGLATTYLFTSPESIGARLPVYPPGTYDVILFDEANEVSRLKGALTFVLPPPPPTVTPPSVKSISPNVLEYTKEPQRVELVGEGFRPGFKVLVGHVATAYTFESPTKASISVPGLTSSAYDLVFMENDKEIGRVTKALKVATPVITSIERKTVEFSRDFTPIQIHGAHFNPALHFTLGFRNVDAEFNSPTHIELRIPPNFPIDTYDLKLFDDIQMLAQYPKAITVQGATGQPAVETLDPKVLDFSTEDQIVYVRGKRFRPNLRFLIDLFTVSSRIEAPDRVRLQIPSLPPGDHELAVADETGVEIARYQKALTVMAPQPVEVEITARIVQRPEIVGQAEELAQRQPAGDRRPTRVVPVLVKVERVTKEPTVPATATEIQNGPQLVVTCVIRLLAAKKADGTLQFEGKPLKGGMSVTVSFQDFVLSGDILSFKVTPGR